MAPALSDRSCCGTALGVFLSEHTESVMSAAKNGFQKTIREGEYINKNDHRTQKIVPVLLMATQRFAWPFVHLHDARNYITKYPGPASPRGQRGEIPLNIFNNRSRSAHFGQLRVSLHDQDRHKTTSCCAPLSTVPIFFSLCSITQIIETNQTHGMDIASSHCVCVISCARARGSSLDHEMRSAETGVCIDLCVEDLSHLISLAGYWHAALFG